MSDNTEGIISSLGEIERKISDGEALLRSTGRTTWFGWILIVLGVLGFIFFIQNILIVFISLVFIFAGVARLYIVGKSRKDIESGLREYRGRKAELQARLMAKK